MSRRGVVMLLAVACVIAGNAYLLRFRVQLRDRALYRAELEDVPPPAPARPRQRVGQDVAATGRRLAELLQACDLAQESAGAARTPRRSTRLAWSVRGSYAQLLAFLQRVSDELPAVCVERLEIEALGPGELKVALEVAL